MKDLKEKKVPVFGGKTAKAGACIQYDFDIKSGKVNDLAITPPQQKMH